VPWRVNEGSKYTGRLPPNYSALDLALREISEYHEEIVREFGRFPERNAILQRTNTHAKQPTCCSYNGVKKHDPIFTTAWLHSETCASPSSLHPILTTTWLLQSETCASPPSLHPPDRSPFRIVGPVSISSPNLLSTGRQSRSSFLLSFAV
jgi:hypothetical protein